MALLIRTENKGDIKHVKIISDVAFKQRTEGEIIEKLRRSKEFVPELSIVAEIKNEVVGYLILFPVKINRGEMAFPVLSLGPMAVHPAHQRMGIGEVLVREGLSRAKDFSYKSVIVIGDPEYYHRFGFIKAAKYGIKTPFDVPEESFMVKELVTGSLQGVNGTVEYPEAFNVAD